MAETTNVDIIAFMGRYPNALKVYLTEDDKSYLNNQYEEALDYAKRNNQILYSVDNALDQVQVYPVVADENLTFYELNSYPNSDLVKVAVDGEQIDLDATPSQVVLAAAFSEAADQAGYTASNFNATYEGDNETWTILLALDDVADVSVLDANDTETFFSQVEAGDGN